MLVLLFIAQSTLREISLRVAEQYPASAPVLGPLQFPEQAAEMKRASQGFYTVQLLPALLGKKTPAFVACGAEQAAVARFGAEHVRIVRASAEAGAECMFEAEQQSGAWAECESGALVWQRLGVSMGVRLRDYVRVRGHEDGLGGGEQAFALACALTLQ